MYIQAANTLSWSQIGNFSISKPPSGGAGRHLVLANSNILILMLSTSTSKPIMPFDQITRRSRTQGDSRNEATFTGGGILAVAPPSTNREFAGECLCTEKERLSIPDNSIAATP